MDTLEIQKRMHINRWYVLWKNQCKLRGEEYDLTFEEFFDIWSKEDRWLTRGRQKDELCMSRIDYEKPWTYANIKIVTRLEMLRTKRPRNKGVV